MDLEPKDGSLDDKFHLNSVSCGEFDSVVSLRMSRFNHACISNACHYYEENTKTKVVHSSKNIKGIVLIMGSAEFQSTLLQIFCLLFWHAFKAILIIKNLYPGGGGKLSPPSPFYFE
jgi:hypothetical protein